MHLEIPTMAMMRNLALAALLALGTASPALAANFSFTGTLATPNDVRYFTFSLAAPNDVTLVTLSYAGGTNAAGQTVPTGGFDAMLWLFDASGTQIADNDDGAGTIDPATGLAYDAKIQRNLAAGAYTLALTAYDNSPVNGTLAGGFNNNGQFDNRSSAWALDILGVDQASDGAVPEPHSWAMMVSGFLLAGLVLRRRAAAQTASGIS